MVKKHQQRRSDRKYAHKTGTRLDTKIIAKNKREKRHKKV